MKVYRAWRSDDRPCDAAGAIVTDKTFLQRASAINWLADWVKDELDGQDDLTPEVEAHLLELYESGRFEELISEYPGHIKVEWTATPLNLGVDEVTVE